MTTAKEPSASGKSAAGAGKAGLEVRVPARQREGVVAGATSLE